MKSSDIIAKKIATLSDFAFTGQGGSVVHINDSLQKLNNITVIPSQNEQGASLAADAYTRSSGKLGVVVATSGPGIINTLQGMACSYYDSIPSLYISPNNILAGFILLFAANFKYGNTSFLSSLDAVSSSKYELA